MAVGAVNDQGAQATYSEPGACLVVAGPSRGSSSSCSGRPGLTTTDLLGSYGRNPGAACEPASWDYTATFGGTSAATPTVAGVVALQLQANPSLGWRDVLEILLRSATKVSPADPDWSTNTAGIAHNHRFGGGLANAAVAVTLATNWSNLGPAASLALLQTNLGLAVPDNTPAGVSLEFVVTNAGFRVEHATLTVTLPHPHYGDLAITLISPGGAVSRLAELHPSSGGSYDGWTLNSVWHWGEPAQGTWTVRIADLAAGHDGTLAALRLDLHGSVPVASLSASRNGTSTVCVLHAAAPGWRYVLQTSPDMTSWAAAGSAIVGLDGQAGFVLANSPTAQQFYRARLGW
jgi:kexin